MRHDIEHWVEKITSYRGPRGHGIVEAHARPLAHYIVDGIPPGGFLQAVLSNDLRLATFTAGDAVAYEAIPAYVYFMANEAPAGCWGSLKAYQHWTGRGKR